jgi:hypothetical protein
LSARESYFYIIQSQDLLRSPVSLTYLSKHLIIFFSSTFTMSEIPTRRKDGKASGSLPSPPSAGAASSSEAPPQSQEKPLQHNLIPSAPTIQTNETASSTKRSILGRRDSVDSTSAVLDTAMLDLTRRRLSTSGSGPAKQTPDETTAADPYSSQDIMGLENHTAMETMNQQQMQMQNDMHMKLQMQMMQQQHPHHIMGNSLGGSMGMYPGMTAGQPSLLHAMHSPPGMAFPTQNPVNAISATQQHLQAQQLQLENHQRQLDFQRQMLFAGMNSRHHSMQPSPHNMNMQQQMMMQMNISNMRPGGNMMAMGSQSQFPHSHSEQTSSMMTPFPMYSWDNLVNNNAHLHIPGEVQMMQGQHEEDVGTQRQWWVCKICQAHAFSSREQAAQHESMCLQNHRNSSGYPTAAMDLTMNIDQSFRGNDAEDAASGMAHGNHTDSSNNVEHAFLHSQHSSRHRQHQQEEDNFYPAPTSHDHPSATPNHSQESSEARQVFLHTGPFSSLQAPIPLSMELDQNSLTPLHCFVRKHCVELFTATKDDVTTPSKGKRKPIRVGQVGIRCPHCHNDDETSKAKERGSIYYPTSIASIYNATMNLLQRHLHNCNAVPPEIRRRYETLKADDARSGTSKKYWIESALKLGLVDTDQGIRLKESSSRAATLSRSGMLQANQNDVFSPNRGDLVAPAEEEPESLHPQRSSSITTKPSEWNQINSPESDRRGTELEESAGTSQQHSISSEFLVTTEDEPYATSFSYLLMKQMQPCKFTEADRLGKRKGLPVGFPGLACRHCFGGYGSGRFFPSSIKTLSDTSKTLNVLHNHMMKCRRCPSDLRESLDQLRKTHDDQRAKMKFGSQKAFFARIWKRLHRDDSTLPPNLTMQSSLGTLETPVQANHSDDMELLRYPPNASDTHAFGLQPPQHECPQPKRKRMS